MSDNTHQCSKQDSNAQIKQATDMKRWAHRKNREQPSFQLHLTSLIKRWLSFQGTPQLRMHRRHCVVGERLGLQQGLVGFWRNSEKDTIATDKVRLILKAFRLDRGVFVP